MACGVNKCPRPLVDGSVVLLVDGERLIKEFCALHKSVYNNITPDLFGRTFIGAIEVNPSEEDAVSATPTMFSSVLAGEPPITTLWTETPLEESTDWPIVDGVFEVVDGKIVVQKAGNYQIDVFISGTITGEGDILTPGLVRHESAVSINDQNKGPAWNFYPAVNFEAVEGFGGSLAWSFHQELDVDDEITIISRFTEITAEIDTLIYTIGNGGFITLTPV